MSTAVDLAPYPGVIKPGAKGRQVIPVQGGLEQWSIYRHKTHPHEAGLRLYAPSGVWQNPTTVQVKHFQTLHAIEASGWYGPRTHVAMAHWFRASDRKILEEIDHEKKVAHFRATLVAWAYATAGRRSDWIYSQGPHRMDLWNRGNDVSLYRGVVGDCSSTSTAMIHKACVVSGLTPPNFGSWPTTYTSISVGTPVSARNLMVGDRVHYGINSHMTFYVGNGIVWSFGGEPGPAFRSLSYRPIYGCRSDVR